LLIHLPETKLELKLPRELLIQERAQKIIQLNSDYELDRNMMYDRTLWRNLIHVADPT